MLKKLSFGLFLGLAAVPSIPVLASGEAPTSRPDRAPDPCTVTWTTPSKDASGSMPIGNGDIGLNVWVEEGGDLLFYIGKTDAWCENSRILKLGRVRVQLSPNPFVKGVPFRQELRAREGLLSIDAGEPGHDVSIRLWVDANLPVIRVEVDARQPVGLSVKLESWRTEKRPLEGDELFSCWHMQGTDPANLGIRLYVTPDTILDDGPDRVVWHHRNQYSVWPIGMKHQGLEPVMGDLEDPLIHRTFGGAISGEALVRQDGITLRSALPRSRHYVSVCALTAETRTREEWLERLHAEMERIAAVPLADARKAHAAWWRAFWDRSWIRITGAPATLETMERNTLPLRIGADSEGQNRFHGHMERARLFNRALAADAIAALARDPEAKVTEGLVGDWRLAGLKDGVVPNSAGGGLDAKIVGKVAPEDHGGRKAIRFTGEGYLEVAHEPRIDLDRAVTLEAWIAPGELDPGGARILDKSKAGTSNGYLLDTFPGNSVRLITHAGQLIHEAKLRAGVWSHVAATVDPERGERRLYVDGRLVASSGGSDMKLPEAVNRAYALQRWVTACAGRGAYPVKFNGSIFTVEPRFTSGAPFDPDYRNWGGDYWWQNTRLPYWPLLASGDYDLMGPVFKMYFDQLPLARHRTRIWFGAKGAFFGETVSFWGMYSNGDYGWNREGKKVGQMDNTYIRHIWQVGLELSFMMLDWFDHTGDEAFLRDRVIPLASDILLYFETRFPRDEKGRIVIQPGQACETWQDAINPLPEVAGLHAVLDRLLALPEGVVYAKLSEGWRKLHGILPEVPLGTEGGKTFVLPAQVFGSLGNIENPELYAVFPYRLYGVGKPNIEIGLATFERRRIRECHGWQQDAIQAAYLGLANDALSMLCRNVLRKHEGSRFPAFFGPNYDWVPDQDHGGNIMSTLQTMLLQADGRSIRVLPAWPKGWDVEFKLHAPLATTVEGAYRAGKLSLKVTPAERLRDVVSGEPR